MISRSPHLDLPDSLEPQYGPDATPVVHEPATCELPAANLLQHGAEAQNAFCTTPELAQVRPQFTTANDQAAICRSPDSGAGGTCESAPAVSQPAEPLSANLTNLTCAAALGCDAHPDHVDGPVSIPTVEMRIKTIAAILLKVAIRIAEGTVASLDSTVASPIASGG